MSQFDRTSYRCRTDPGDKVSVHALSETQRVYVVVVPEEGDPLDVSLPPKVARAMAQRLIEAADHAEGVPCQH